MKFTLIKVELKKVLPYRPVWIFLGLYFFLLPVIFGFFKNTKSNGLPIDVAKVYGFPDVWSYLPYFASYFHIVPAFLIIMLVCNEYSYRTFRQHVIEGLSRLELVVGKLLLIGLLSLVLSLYVLLIGLFFGLQNTPELALPLIFEKMHFIGLFGLQAFAYMTLALIFAIIIKRSALSIVLFLIYVFIFEKLVQGIVPESVKLYFPANSFSDLIGFPWKGMAMMMGVQVQELSLYVAIGLTIFYILGFSGLSYFILKKRDL